MQLPCRRLRRPRRVLRHGPAASYSAPMASRLVIVCQTRQPDAGMPPGAATASVATTVPASIKDSCLVPSCPASCPKVSQGRRTAALGCQMPTSGASRSAPAALVYRPHGASVPNAGASPRPLRNALASRKRHPDVGGYAWPPRPHAGFPPAVRFPGLPESPPATPRKGGLKDGCRIASAPKRHQKRVLSSPRRRWPQCRLGALSLPTSPRSRLRQRNTRDFRATGRRGSDSAPC